MKVTVAYATETGTSQALAEKLLVKLKLYAVDSECVALTSIEELNDEDWLESPDSLIIFIISTTGEGEVPNAMKSFWRKLLIAQLPSDFLSDAAKFAVFGLGDSSYEKFNAAARKVRTRLLQLGAIEFCATGSGDEQVDTELSFDRWSLTVVDELRKKEHLNWNEQERKLMLPNKYDLNWSPSLLSSNKTNNDPRKGSDLLLQKIERLSALDWQQDVRHVEIECVEQHQSGDVFNLWPEIDELTVKDFLKAKYPSLVETERHRGFECNPPHPNLPDKTTPLDALRLYLDLNAVPTRFFFLQAAEFCSNPEEKDKMLEMASSAPDNAASYITYCKRERRTFAEVLKDFESCDIPFSVLLELLPPLRPRAFSISSSFNAHPNQIHITVALVEYLTPWKRKKTGTCSQFIRSLSADGQRKVRGYITQGTMRLPKDKQAPLILIGTGTGCAPMRSMMYERAVETKDESKRNILFYFGCRSPDADYLYENEWGQICDQINVAFSQKDKRRVPVLLARDENIIYDILVNQHGYLYISGSAKRMPADIRETLTQILMRKGEMSRDDATKFIRQLERERRYVVEAWS